MCDRNVKSEYILIKLRAPPAAPLCCMTTNSSLDLYYNRFLLLGKPSSYHTLRLQFRDIIVGLIYTSLEVTSPWANNTLTSTMVVGTDVYTFLQLVVCQYRNCASCIL